MQRLSFAALLDNSRCKIALLFIVFSLSTSLSHAQDDDPANRTLSGSSTFNLGRHIGGTVSLGTLTVTSDDLDMDPARPISVAENGFAFLANDILIRNGSGGPLVFDQDSQSHDFDVFYLGVGDYSENVTLPGSNFYTNGSGNRVTAYGGNWFTQGEYTRLNGDRETFSIDDERFRVSSNSRGFSPVTLGLSDNPSEIFRSYNRASSTQRLAQTLPLNSDLDGNFRWTAAENQTPVVERRNTLFEVAPAAEGEADPVLDLSGINISAQGTSLRNRSLFQTGDTPLDRSSLIQHDLGRFVLGQAPGSFQSSNTVVVETSGSDNERSRLTLNSFNESADGVTASLSNNTLFDADDSTASIDLTADFTIDSTQTGTFSKSIDVVSSIVGEGIAGETVQSSLEVGYKYAVVENNSAVANDITVFKLEGEDVSNRSAFNQSARAEFSRNTHTDIFVSQFAALENTSLQTINLSEGNGIFGEGLAGENVTANASYDVHQVTVQGSDLSITESGIIEDEIVFENNRAVDDTTLQAQAILSRVVEAGSSRWSLTGLDGWDEDLAAGESLTLNPFFDDAGIDASEDTLGRNYRKSITFQFRDGVRNLASNIVDGTDVGLSGEGSRDFNIFGSIASTQEATYFLERKDVLVGSSGSAFVAAGTSLGSEGINLTNESSNTSSSVGTPTEIQILDSAILNSDTEISVQFTSLDNIDPNAEFAGSDTSEFFSDIVEVNGLGDIFHVLELSYDESQGAADLHWYSEDLGEWVNAVLGNSNVGGISLSTGQALINGETVNISEYLDEIRFLGSYEDYLLNLESEASPELGAFGYSDGRAWAVIDHNSSFAVAAVPEPSSVVLLGAFAAGLFVRRRR